MNEAVELLASPPRGTGDGTDTWSTGVFAAGAFRVPGECLHRCLDGDPEAGHERGCGVLKGLLDRTRRVRLQILDQPSEAPPAVCDQGCGLYLAAGDGGDQPDVLVVQPGAQGHDRSGRELNSALRTVAELTAKNWSLQRENEGFADEMLRTYEQINFIFDVSMEIATLTDPSEVRRMLLTKLRDMFAADEVIHVSSDRRMIKQLVSPDKAGGVDRLKVTACGTPQRACVVRKIRLEQAELPAEYHAAAERLSRTRQVFVPADDATNPGHGTSMWGPLCEEEHGFAIVGITRRSATFTSGDMLLLDSALTFGGQILRNLQLVEQLKRTSFEAVRALVNALDQKDNYTYGHSERVGFLARITAQAMGLPPSECQELEWAGLLHDVGKIGIPESVLNKPGGLSAEEFAVIKEHPARSEEVLRPVASLAPILDGVLHHHENPDGSGYPHGLKGDEIPMMARIIHVVDVFDALTTSRSYRSAFSFSKAAEIMHKDAGTKLDADVVDKFFEAFTQLPVSHPEQYETFFTHITEAAS